MGQVRAGRRRCVAELAQSVLASSAPAGRDAMNAALVRSYRYCEEVARHEAGNFYPAFLLLPAPRRRAMCALYTYMRIADDLSDEMAPLDVKRQQLAGWRGGLRAAM